MGGYYDLEQSRAKRPHNRRPLVWGDFARFITVSFFLLAVTTAVATIWLIAHIREAKAHTALVPLHQRPAFNASSFDYNDDCDAQGVFGFKKQQEQEQVQSSRYGFAMDLWVSKLLGIAWDRIEGWQHAMQHAYELRWYGCITSPTEKQMRTAYIHGVHPNVCKHRRPDMMADYNNVSLNLTVVETPDPFVTYANGNYYMTFTTGDKVEIWWSSNLLTIGRGQKRVIWTCPPGLGGTWAPELHVINGQWYVYVAVEHPKVGNRSHRMFVLVGPPADQDPGIGSWQFAGPLQGMHDHWAIDGTIFPYHDKNYFIYSGWPFLNQSMSEKVQELFIIEMQDATRVKGRPVSIAKPSHSWEKSGDSEILEGPQTLIHPDGRSWVGIAYSCAGSWTSQYKMNTIQLVGPDPLEPRNWRKSEQPLLHNRRCGQKPFAPGHGCFMNVGGDTVSIFHAKDNKEEGSWAGRTARMQRLIWTPSGPHMGEVGPPTHDPQQYLSPSLTTTMGGFPGRDQMSHLNLRDRGSFGEKLIGVLNKFR